MDLVKKNILSIVFAAVALLALIAWIWPLGSIKGEAEQELAKRAQVYKQMQDVLKANRSLPLTALNGEEQQLGIFPTKNVIDWGKETTKRMQDEVQGVRAVAKRLNERELLVPNSLPVPAPTFEFRFRDVYLRYMADFAKSYKAGTPPTQADITAAEQKLWISKFESQIIIRDGQPDARSQALVNEDFNKERTEIPARVKLARAQSILFYMDPQAIAVSSDFAAATATAGAAPSPLAIWDAQLKVWIQDDIAKAIVALNERESKLGNVTDAPVKQLLKVVIEGLRGAGAAAPAASGSYGPPPGMGGYGSMGGGPGGGYGGMPGYGGPGGMSPYGQMGMGSSTPTAPIGPDSLTGHTANALYDVVPFQVLVHIEADKLPDFLEELSRNRFITPSQLVSMKSVDTVVLGAATNVMYGSVPVVEALVTAEAVLLRDWTVKFMPPEIRQSLAVDATAVSDDGSAGR